MSPGLSAASASARTASVTFPAGTMLQTTFGVCVSLPIISVTDPAASPPIWRRRSCASGEGSQPTTRCPRWIRRSAMLPPILPSPTIPISIAVLSPSSRCLRRRAGGNLLWLLRAEAGESARPQVAVSAALHFDTEAELPCSLLPPPCRRSDLDFLSVSVYNGSAFPLPRNACFVRGSLTQLVE